MTDEQQEAILKLAERHGYVLMNGGFPKAYHRAVAALRLTARQLGLTVSEVMDLVESLIEA